MGVLGANSPCGGAASLASSASSPHLQPETQLHLSPKERLVSHWSVLLPAGGAVGPTSTAPPWLDHSFPSPGRMGLKETLPKGAMPLGWK